MEEDEQMYLEADIEEGHVLADIEDEEMYLLGGRYGGGPCLGSYGGEREDVPGGRY